MTHERRPNPSPDTAIGGYLLEECIGRGGMGTVYRARHTASGRTVAIKRLELDGDDPGSQAAELIEEGRLQARVSTSPHVVTVEDVFAEQGAVWVVMEYVAGSRTLRSALGTEPVGEAGSLSVPDAVYLFIQACLGLKSVHDAGIVHGDIKAGNFLLADDDRLLLTDFGLATAGDVDERETRPFATTQTLAPEVVRSGVSPASDLYALGFSFYEILAGSRRFREVFEAEVTAYNPAVAWIRWHSAADKSAPPVSELIPALPADVAGIVDRMLAKEPTDRPTVDEVLAVLEHVAPIALSRAGHQRLGATFDVVARESEADDEATTLLPRKRLSRVTRLVMAAGTAAVLALLTFAWPRHAAPVTPAGITVVDPAASLATSSSDLLVAGRLETGSLDGVRLALPGQDWDPVWLPLDRQGRFEGRIELPSPEGTYELLFTERRGRELCRRTVEVDRTPPRSLGATVSANPSDTDRPVLVELSFDEPVTVLDRDHEVRDTLSSGSGEVRLPAPGVDAAVPGEVELALTACDRAGNLTQLTIPLLGYSHRRVVEQLLTERPDRTDGWLAPEVEPAVHQERASAWVQRVQDEALLRPDGRRTLLEDPVWIDQQSRIAALAGDTEPPVLSIVRPDGDRRLATNRTTVVVRATDPHLAGVTLDGQPMEATDDDLWVLRGLELQAEGTNAYRLAATDRNGNVSERALEIERDTTAPRIDQASPVAQQHLPASGEVSVRLVLDEPVEAVRLAGQDLTVDGPIATGRLRVRAERGGWQVPWSATDRLGNEREGVLAWEVDYPWYDASPRLAEDFVVVSPASIEDDGSHYPAAIEHRLTGQTFLYVAGGRFELGSPEGPGHQADEGPARRVRMTGFYVARTETTWDAWIRGGGQAAGPELGADFSGRPVSSRTWRAIEAWCRGNGLSLPSEAQWEYAASGPDDHVLPGGGPSSSSAAALDDQGAQRTHLPPAVGSLPDRASWCGALDMDGGVMEFCADVYDPHQYAALSEDALDPVRHAPTGPRVLRGGSFETDARRARTASRDRQDPDRRHRSWGFRPVVAR